LSESRGESLLLDIQQIRHHTGKREEKGLGISASKHVMFAMPEPEEMAGNAKCCCYGSGDEHVGGNERTLLVRAWSPRNDSRASLSSKAAAFLPGDVNVDGLRVGEREVNYTKGVQYEAPSDLHIV
jgi:hypothetical protein